VTKDAAQRKQMDFLRSRQYYLCAQADKPCNAHTDITRSGKIHPAAALGVFIKHVLDYLKKEFHFLLRRYIIENDLPLPSPADFQPGEKGTKITRHHSAKL
jgi:hypothetical protein